jgi:GNAT superfamily N-acetyltransferase
VEIRPAEPDDVEALASLRAQWRGQPVEPTYLEEFRTWYQRERTDRWWWVAIDDGVAVGMVNVTVFSRMPSPGRPPARWGYLANMFVRASHRRRGIGSSLLREAVDRASSEGLVRIVLAPSDMAVGLYEGEGFRPATDLMLLPLE